MTATGGGQSVRTAAAVQREVESYDVTLKFIGRDGNPAKYYSTDLFGVTGPRHRTSGTRPYDESGTVTVRVPKGGYLFNSWSSEATRRTPPRALDWLAQPKLSVTKNTTVTVDARTAKPVDITVPDTAAKSACRGAVATPSTSPDGSYVVRLVAGLVRQLPYRARRPAGHRRPLNQQWGGHWAKGADAEYDTVAGGKVKQLATGYTKHYKASELATVKTGLGASSSGKKGAITPCGELPGSSRHLRDPASSRRCPARARCTCPPRAGSSGSSTSSSTAGSTRTASRSSRPYYTLGTPQTFKARQELREDLQHGGLRPAPRARPRHLPRRQRHLRLPAAVRRRQDPRRLLALLVGHHDPLPQRRQGRLERRPAVRRAGVFKVPAGDAAYKLTTSVKRSVKVAAASTRIDASWTFRSKKADLAKLPASTVRFDAAVGLDSRVPAGKKVSVPVTVQGSAAGKQPEVAGGVRVVRLRPDLEEGHRQERQDRA